MTEQLLLKGEQKRVAMINLMKLCYKNRIAITNQFKWMFYIKTKPSILLKPCCSGLVICISALAEENVHFPSVPLLIGTGKNGWQEMPKKITRQIVGVTGWLRRCKTICLDYIVKILEGKKAPSLHLGFILRCALCLNVSLNVKSLVTLCTDCFDNIVMEESSLFFW